MSSSVCFQRPYSSAKASSTLPGRPTRPPYPLFTNIMRIRRLLGEDGAEIIRVTEDGYRFVPPRDYVFVSPR